LVAERLADSALNGSGPVDPDHPITVAVEPDDTISDLLDRQRRALAAGRAFLAVRVKGSTVEIGPLLRPGGAGCCACAQERHRSVAGVPPMHPMLSEEPARVLLAPHWQQLIAGLVADRVTGQAPDHEVLAVRLADGEISRHRLTPVPDCPACGSLPDDGPDAGQFEFMQQLQAEPDRLRIKPMLALDTLRSQLVDHRFGPVTHAYRDQIAPMAFVGIELATLARRPRMDGYGRCPDFEDAHRVGLLEAVERESGSWPSARRSVVQGSFTELAAQALDPARLGLPDPAYDDHPNSLLDPYSAGAGTSWVWAHSFETGGPVLVPEHVAYYGIPRAPDRARYLYECSNGCAVGGCLEEAILYGCLEFVERDAFLLSWYSQTPGTRLNPAGVTDDVSRAMLETLTGEGFETRLYDITSDVGVPTIWALALNPASTSAASLSAAAAHPDPQKAIRGALAEVAAMAVIRNRQGESSTVEQRRELLAEPTQVRSLDDHVGLYTLPEALPRLGWLIDGAGPAVDIDQHFGDWRQAWVRRDLTGTMRLLVAAMAAAGLPPVVVRQTSSRDVQLGVEVVKVIAPGGLAMTFGHVHHRTGGIVRLDRARALAGTTGPLLPHPFP
ncbi:MAG: TOMM precursor leader peptide-binding protein, partial [Jatrophihabitantaceae bacterium]